MESMNGYNQQIEDEYLDKTRVLRVAEAQTAMVGGHLQPKSAQLPQARQRTRLDVGLRVIARRVVDLGTNMS